MSKQEPPTKSAVDDVTPAIKDEWETRQAELAKLNKEEDAARYAATLAGFDKEKQALLTGDKKQLQTSLELAEMTANSVIGTPKFKEYSTRANLLKAAIAGDKDKVDSLYIDYKKLQESKLGNKDTLSALEDYAQRSKQPTGVEPGKELTVIEPGLARPIPTGEPGLVPTGRGRTTYIAGEEGISAGGQSPMGPTPIRTEGRTIEERIRSGNTPSKEPGTEVIPAGKLETAAERYYADQVKRATAKEEFKAQRPVPSSPSSFTTARKVGAGMVAAGAVGKALPEDEVVLPAEPRAGVSSPAALGLPAESATPPKAEVPPPAATVEDRIKEKKAATPTPPSGGKATREVATSDSAVQNAISQAKIGTSVQDDVSALEQKLSSGQDITRGELLGIVKKMEGLRPDQVQADPGLLGELKAAREDARRAYREQATRNEWSEVAQTLTNAVANFVAAQRGVADRALALPNVDYNARTQQALREYQTELGSIGEQRKELERDVERRQSVAEKEASLQQRSYDRLLQLGEQQISAQERKAEKERDYNLQLQLNAIKEKKEAKAEEKATRKEEAKAKAAGTEQYLSALTKDIQQTDDRIKELQQRQATAAAVVNSSSKDFDENFNKYAASRGVTKEEPTFQEKGWFGKPEFDQDTARKAAAADLVRAKQELDAFRQKKAAKEQEQQSLLTGGQQAVRTAPAQPAGQQPATGGKVLSESDLEAYAKSQGTTPAAARNFLLSQGYTIRGK